MNLREKRNGEGIANTKTDPGAASLLPRPTMLPEGPVDRPRNWRELVNRPESAAQLEAIRRSVVRGSPFGSGLWTKRLAACLGLTHTLNPRRPEGNLVLRQP